MIPFTLSGNTVTFTGATSAPTSVQCISNNDVQTQQYVLTNVGAVTVFVGWGKSDEEAKANSVVPTSALCFPLLAATQVSITGPSNAYFSGITGSSTAIVYVSPGYGS